MPSQIIQASTGPTVQRAADHTMRRGPPPDTSTNLSTRLSTTMEQPWEGGIILNPAQQTLSLLIINTSEKKNIYTSREIKEAYSPYTPYIFKRLFTHIHYLDSKILLIPNQMSSESFGLISPPQSGKELMQSVSKENAELERQTLKSRQTKQICCC